MIANQQKENCKALCKAFVEAGIPLNKLSHPSLRNYLESVTNRPVPTESLIRKVYLPQEAEKQVQVMREALSHEHIWITIDETTDATGRSIALVLAGALTKTEHLKPHFVLAEELQQVNNTTIAQVSFLFYIILSKYLHIVFILYSVSLKQFHIFGLKNLSLIRYIFYKIF